MGGLYYFAAGLSAMNDEKAVGRFGMKHAHGGITHRGVRGPGGAQGVAFTLCDELPSSVSDRCDWAPYPGQEGLWLGVDRSDPPGPAELEREDLIPGVDVEMGDGNRWTIPLARALPRQRAWDGTGWGDGPVVAQYAELFDRAQAAFSALVHAIGLTEEPPSKVTLDDESDLAVAALGVNYKVGPAEASYLGLVTTKAQGRAVLAMCDFEGLKKKLEEGLSSMAAGRPGGEA